jgi:hypothetical protein
MLYAREFTLDCILVSSGPHDGINLLTSFDPMPDVLTVGDELPPNIELIEVHVPALRNLFNPVDPSPLVERDLDPRIEEFIVGWARSAPRDAPLGLRVLVDESPPPEVCKFVPKAIRDYFNEESASARRRLSRLFSVGRTSLAIGIVALVAAVTIGGLLETALGDSRLGGIIRETMSIGGWVAMWRPLEIFLYDWWPIRRERQLYDRFSDMPVQIQLGLRPSTST